MRRRIAALLLVPHLAAAQAEPPGLPAAEREALLAGRSLDMARPAERHDYPGPFDVLDRASELGLDGAQLGAVRMVLMRLGVQAQAFGAEIIAKEEALDRLFANGTAEPAAISGLTQDIALLRGRLRAAHLVAHVETHAILTEEQRRRLLALTGGSDR